MPGCPALSPDGQQLAISNADPLFHMNIVDNEGLPLPATADSPVQIYAAKDGKLLFHLDASADFLTFNSDGGFLAGGHHSDNSVIVWDARNGKRIQVLGGYQTPFTEGEFSPDGRRLAAVSAEGVRVWNLATGNEVLSVKGVIRVQFSPDGRYFAGMTSDGNIKVWKVGPRN
jgi:WD40 repeat protein